MSEKKKAETPEELEAEETVEEVEAEAVDAEDIPDERDEKIKQLESEVAAQKDKYMRLAAEYDNYRKRTANEKLGIYDDATAKAVTELLPVADSVRMALENLKNSDPEIIKGVELIKSQLDRSFEKLKIESYGETGDEFDPNLHNAVMHVEDESLGENVVAEELLKGYTYRDTVVRHAMVKVAN